MDITEIVDQPLTTLVSDHLVCDFCRVVDRDRERCTTGYACPSCGMESQGGMMYFSINTHVLVDLIQEAYHAPPNELLGRGYDGMDSHSISVVIYFCTLREVLMDNLVSELLVAKEVPEGIRDRLLSDNKLYLKKQNSLFPSLVGEKWKDAVGDLGSGAQIDYVEVDGFVEDAVKARNNFLHEGSRWSINRDLSTGCLRSLWGLISLYVGLHNRYVHPVYKSRLEGV